MADELIDIISDDLSVIKTCYKSEAHKNGWLHASVHIWFYTNKGELLIQKRSSEKISFPHLWDVSVAGHISSGEDVLTSAIRETEEEIGLSVSKDALLKIGKFKELHKHNKDFIDNEIHHVYISPLNIDIKDLKVQEEELSAIKLISISNFKKALRSPDFQNEFVSHSKNYYEFVLNKIENHL